MDVDDRDPPESGGRLLADRYRLGAFVGQGGAATVYEAVDVVLGRRVAVKLYESADPLGRYRFASEARLLAGLSHPGLVTVYDVCLDGDQPFLVMRLVDGPSVRDLLARGAFVPDAVARIGVRLAHVLAYIHAHDVVHRDVKPGNVLVDAAGDCHLTDFGLARATSAVHLTGPGEYVGTAAYLAPEQITDADVGPPADIYSLGLLLLECLTGRTEYTGNAAETALARLSRPPRIPDDLPGSWWNVLTAMTAQDPAARPAAARCATLLTTVADEPGDTVEALVPRPRPASPRPVHAGLAALAVAAVAAAVAAAPEAVPGQPVGRPPAVAPETSRTTEPPPPPAPRVVPPGTTTFADRVTPRTHREPGPPARKDKPNKGKKHGKGRGKG